MSVIAKYTQAHPHLKTVPSLCTYNEFLHGQVHQLARDVLGILGVVSGVVLFGSTKPKLTVVWAEFLTLY
jgi:hypothetical protein